MAADLVSVEEAVKRRQMDDSMARTLKRFQEEVDSEYWVCVVFQTREQKDAFLKASDWGGPLREDKYLSGTRLAKQLKITLPPSPVWRDVAPPKTKWAALAMDKE